MEIQIMTKKKPQNMLGEHLKKQEFKNQAFRLFLEFEKKTPNVSRQYPHLLEHHKATALSSLKI